MKEKSSGMVLSGVDRDQYIGSDGVPLDDRFQIDAPNLKSWIGSGETSPAVFGQSVIDKLPEPVQEFLTTPAPSSPMAMGAVTLAGAAGAHLAGRYGGVEPKYRAAAGLAVVLGGHYLLKSWEAKSIGYGALFDGLAQMAVDKVRAMRAASAGGAQANSTSTGGAQGTIPVGGVRNAIPEAELLTMVEEGTVELPGASPSGAISSRPSGEIIRDANLMSSHLMGLTRARRRVLRADEIVLLADGRAMPLGQYLESFRDQVELRRRAGLQRRSRRAKPSLPLQTEFDFLRGLINRCKLRMFEVQPEEGPSLPGTVREHPAIAGFLGGMSELDIAMFDGTTRPAAAYAAEFPERVEWAKAQCREEAMAPQIVPDLPPAPSESTPRGSQPGSSTLQLGERVQPLTPAQPVTTISATSTSFRPIKDTAILVQQQPNVTVRRPPFQR